MMWEEMSYNQPKLSFFEKFEVQPDSTQVDPDEYIFYDYLLDKRVREAYKEGTEGEI